MLLAECLCCVVLCSTNSQEMTLLMCLSITDSEHSHSWSIFVSSLVPVGTDNVCWPDKQCISFAERLNWDQLIIKSESVLNILLSDWLYIYVWIENIYVAKVIYCFVINCNGKWYTDWCAEVLYNVLGFLTSKTHHSLTYDNTLISVCNVCWSGLFFILISRKFCAKENSYIYRRLLAFLAAKAAQ